MIRLLLTVGWLLVTLATMSVPASATTILELSKKPGSKTILNIGTAPPEKKTPLNLGALRTREAQLPAAPLSRSQRMTLRAKMAVDRQRAVQHARRERKVIKREHDDEFDEEIAIDEFGQPYME